MYQPTKGAAPYSAAFKIASIAFAIGTGLTTSVSANIVDVYDASIILGPPTTAYQGVRVLADGHATGEIKILSKIAGRNLISGDATSVFENMKLAMSFYEGTFGRQGYDGSQGKVRVSINTDREMPFDLIGVTENAYWDSSNQLFSFGHGGDYIKSLASSIEVVAHEFTHAVISSTSNLEYFWQSGALNEHLADVFGVIIRHELKQNPEGKEFLVGENTLGPKLSGKPNKKGFIPTALRDMENPEFGAAPQPGKVSDISDEYKTGCTSGKAPDNCGVHNLSGIPNKIAATIIKGIGWETAANLYYAVMTEKLKSNSTFAEYANALVQVGYQIEESTGRSDILPTIKQALLDAELI